jgi:hypothetical protein
MQEYGALVKLKGIELEFMRARSGVIVARATDRQKMLQLRRIEDDFCRRLANEPRFKLEVKRRIAETLLDLSISRGRSIATCRTRLKALTELGFSDIEQKAHHHLMYARAALERGHPQIACTLANRMVQELRRSLNRRRSLLGRELLGHFERLARQASEVVNS